jgi:hypothetical protein
MKQLEYIPSIATSTREVNQLVAILHLKAHFGDDQSSIVAKCNTPKHKQHNAEREREK